MNVRQDEYRGKIKQLGAKTYKNLYIFFCRKDPTGRCVELRNSTN